MSGPLTPPDPPGGGQGPPDHVNLARALVLLVVAVVAGVLLLNVASRPPVNPSSATTTSSTTTTTRPTTSSTTTTSVDPANVVVQVANGSATPGVAGTLTTTLKGEGWATQPPLNTDHGEVATSTVYYGAGQQAAAAEIATMLKLKPSAVQPLTNAVPVASPTGTDVVVVIGTDLGPSLAAS